jgi:hypothetical protein
LTPRTGTDFEHPLDSLPFDGHGAQEGDH